MKTPTAKTIQQNGEYGNKCVAHGKIVFEGDAASSSGVLFKLPPKAKVVGVKMINEALGASSTIALDAVGSSGSTELIGATNTADAGRTDYDGKPLTLDEETEVTATVGGAAATGDIDVVVDYVYIGA